jgi:hypothetical protein
VYLLFKMEGDILAVIKNFVKIKQEKIMIIFRTN